MFTGIVEELGSVRSRDGKRFEFGAAAVLDGVNVGDSIAVNGCCLTVVEVGVDWWAADVVDETLSRSTHGTLAVGDRVNLERPMPASGRFDGHIVQGHVDGVGEVTSPAPDLVVRVPSPLSRYVVEKGSITIDGVSLTVASLHGDLVGVAVIPHTAEVTTLGLRRPGDGVNLEVDILAKYVERLLAPMLEVRS